jgi:serine/threonine-protein kinase
MSSNGSLPKLPRQFSGRWNKASYLVLAELGQGANGAVYLADCNGSRQAVKIGQDAIDILMEVNMLKHVQQVRDIRVGPLLCDVDDLVINGKAYTFYAMEYLEGEQLDQYVKRAGTEWVPVLMVQLLTRLDVLHRNGWVFGDLKPENVIVNKADKQVRLIDFGGVTKMGKAVRQFTEEYDRAAWQAGDRRAEISYDLFSLAVMMTRLMCGAEEWKTMRREPRQTGLLCDIIRKNDSLYPYRAALVKAFHGKFPSAVAMKNELLAVLRERMLGRGEKQASGAAGKWIGGFFVASLLALAGSLYYAWL